MNRQQQDMIEYLKEENRILREKLGNKRILLDISQKKRLARLAIKMGSDALRACATLFSPDTLLRWHRWLIARKYDGSGKRGPKPKKANQVRNLVIKMAQENPDWGYGHIHGELIKLQIKISWQTVRRIMREEGLLPEPNEPRRMSWKTFLKSHFQSMAGCDFFTVETWTPRGLIRFYVFFVIDLCSRHVKIAGITHSPNEEWMLQQARNLTDSESGFLKGKRFLIHDRDPLFTTKFRKTMRQGGVRTLKMPRRSPNLNAYSERFVQTIKNECTNKMVFFGEKHLRYTLDEYLEHYLKERPHQGVGNQILTAPAQAPPDRGRVYCRERLGGLLKSYYRKAA
ncbi:MAG: integrase core domain-containing protein [Phycisphaerales bacterium]|nr:integrase core domain-containing protein [Phycisphaerales bacterium]